MIYNLNKTRENWHATITYIIGKCAVMPKTRVLVMTEPNKKSVESRFNDMWAVCEDIYERFPKSEPVFSSPDNEHKVKFDNGSSIYVVGVSKNQHMVCGIRGDIVVSFIEDEQMEKELVVPMLCMRRKGMPENELIRLKGVENGS